MPSPRFSCLDTVRFKHLLLNLPKIVCDLFGTWILNHLFNRSANKVNAAVHLSSIPVDWVWLWAIWPDHICPKISSIHVRLIKRWAFPKFLVSLIPDKSRLTVDVLREEALFIFNWKNILHYGIFLYREQLLVQEQKYMLIRNK